MIYPNDSKIPSKYRDIGRDMIEFESLRMKQNEEKNIWDVQAKLDEIINIVKDLKKKKKRKVIVVRQVRGKRKRMTMA